MSDSWTIDDRTDVRQDVPPDRAQRRRPRRVGGDDVVRVSTVCVSLFTTLASTTPAPNPIANDTVHNDPPSAATSTRASTSAGNAISTSMRYTVDSPTHRGARALKIPITRPMTAAIATDASTTNSVVRAPTSTWLKRSLPPPSVPNQ